MVAVTGVPVVGIVVTVVVAAVGDVVACMSGRAVVALVMSVVGVARIDGTDDIGAVASVVTDVVGVDVAVVDDEVGVGSCAAIALASVARAGRMCARAAGTVTDGVMAFAVATGVACIRVVGVAVIAAVDVDTVCATCCGAGEGY